jgi:hypothetical protein
MLRFREYYLIKEAKVRVADANACLDPDAISFIWIPDGGLLWHDPLTGDAYMGRKRLGHMFTGSFVAHDVLLSWFYGGPYKKLKIMKPEGRSKDSIFFVRGRITPDKEIILFHNAGYTQGMDKKKFDFLVKKAVDAIYRYIL